MAVVNPKLNTKHVCRRLHTFFLLGLSSIFKECCLEMKSLKISIHYVLACVKLTVWGWVWAFLVEFFGWFFLSSYFKKPHPLGLRMFSELSCPWAGSALNLQPCSVIQ